MPSRAPAALLLLACPLVGSTRSAAAQETAAPPSRESPIIFRDGYGVPHVFGPTDESVVFGAAWVQDPTAFSDSLASLPVAGAPGFLGSIFGEDVRPAAVSEPQSGSRSAARASSNVPRK